MSSERPGPVVDEVEFGLGRAVTIGRDIVAHVFDSVAEEFTLLQLKGNTVLEEHITDAYKVQKDGGEDS